MGSIGFGGGCHWCTEAVFQALRGVSKVAQGWIKSEPPHDTFSEAVLVTFDSTIIDFGTLIEVHLRTHASQSNHSFREKYRSAVYIFNDDQYRAAQEAIDALRPLFERELVTRVLPYRAFKASDLRFQNYYQTNPDRPFCKAFIDPKLDLIRKKFRAHSTPRQN